MKNIFYNSWVAKTVLCLSKCHTIMLFGFVFSKLKEEEVAQRVKNHECVHARQWFEVTALSGAVILALVLALGISAWCITQHPLREVIADVGGIGSVCD